MHFAKKLKDLDPQRTLRWHLHKYLGGDRPGRSIKTLHASELTKPGFCPRQYALMDVLKVKPSPEHIVTSLAVTFDIGATLEDSIANWFADMNLAIANWKCRACGTKHSFCRRPPKCSTCNSQRFEYDQMRFTSSTSGISCGIDLLIDLKEPKLRPVEFKTIDKEEFKKLVAPLAEHRYRTNLYLRSISESDQPEAQLVNTQRGTVLYASKGGYGCYDPEVAAWGIGEKFSPFKEYEVLRDDTKTWDPVRRARAVLDYRAGKVGMPCGVCASKADKTAQACPVVSACFGGQYPAAHDWTTEGHDEEPGSGSAA